jgi:hypothetical protein
MTTESTPVAASAPRTLSILSLVAGIAAIPLGHLVVLPLAAIVLGFIARTREPEGRTFSNWGIVLGFVLLFWWVIVGSLAVAVFVPLGLIHHFF